MNDINGTLKLAEKMLSAETNDLRTFLYKDIVMNAVKCQGLDILDLKIMDRVLAEFQHAACVFKPYRSTRKVSIFGSSRVAEGSPCYELAVDLQYKLTLERGSDAIILRNIENYIDCLRRS